MWSQHWIMAMALCKDVQLGDLESGCNEYNFPETLLNWPPTIIKTQHKIILIQNSNKRHENESKNRLHISH